MENFLSRDYIYDILKIIHIYNTFHIFIWKNLRTFCFTISNLLNERLIANIISQLRHIRQSLLTALAASQNRGWRSPRPRNLQESKLCTNYFGEAWSTTWTKSFPPTSRLSRLSRAVKFVARTIPDVPLLGDKNRTREIKIERAETFDVYTRNCSCHNEDSE